MATSRVWVGLLAVCLFACKGAEKAEPKGSEASDETKGGPVCDGLKACQKGCDAAKGAHCAALGDLLFDLPAKERDEDAVKKAFQAACDAGEQRGCAMYGYVLAQGPSFADSTKAWKLYEKACKAGEPTGCVLQGSMLEGSMREEKYVVEKDHAKAMKLFQRACDDGYAPGCERLGGGYSYPADDTPRDPTKAYKAYAKACSMGCQGGCSSQGQLLILGSGVEADAKKGEKLISEACKKGRPMFPDFASVACDMLGGYYEEGKYGIDAAPAKAWAHYTRACAMGLKSACAKATELDPKK